MYKTNILWTIGIKYHKSHTSDSRIIMKDFQDEQMSESPNVLETSV